MPRLPPGPRGGVLTAVLAMRDPFAALARYARKYGDPFTLPAPFQRAIVVTGDPAAIRAVFAADPDTFGSSAAKVMGPVLGRGSVLVLEGAAHRRARKLLNPPFHGERMRAHARTIENVARARIARLEVGARFSVQEVAEAISLEVILRVVFGIRDAARLDRFAEATRQLMGSLGPAAAFAFLRRSFGGLGPWARFRRRRAELAALVEEEIARRRGDGERDREDVLGMLLAARYDDGSAMSGAEIFDQLLTVVAAGHETTTIALSWAFHWLHRTPEALQRLRAELDALPEGSHPEAPTRLPYLGAVIQETLRLYPVVPLATRLLVTPFELNGHALPAGVTVGLATGLVHYREDLYPEPQRFAPERFLGRTFGPAEYFPFGGGTRRCLGAAFGTFELAIALATMLRELRVRAADDRPVRPSVRAAGVGPGRPVEMVVTERRRYPS